MPLQVVVRGGGSSSGTTSVARELQGLLPRPSLLLGVDTLVDAMPEPQADRHEAAITVDADGTVVPGGAFRTLKGSWYRGVAETARCGALVVVDEVLLGGGESQARLRDALTGLSVLWVAVRCDSAVAAAREAIRPDREPGTARAQARSVHRRVGYDLQVDTTHRTAAERAQAVVGRIDAGR